MPIKNTTNSPSILAVTRFAVIFAIDRSLTIQSAI
jgi:hypothetical protein